MKPQKLAERRIELDDMRAFAQGSGDWNPVHTDPVVARRLVTGGVVAHGMSILLWMLDEHLRASGPVPRALIASFPRPLAPGDVACLHRQATSGGHRLSVSLAGDETSSALLDVKGGRRLEGMPPQAAAPHGEPNVASFEALRRARGALEANGVDARDELQYPHVHRGLGPRAVAGLHALSTLVGMHCPGLHSLIAALSLTFDADDKSPRIEWHVARHSSPLAPLRIAFQGAGMSGHIDAFVRPEPVLQPPVTELRHLVRPGEFAGQRALVIGGSRGLGELSAKIIALGGGRLTITYREGSADAARVAGEIRGLGGRCDVVRFGAREARADMDAVLATGIEPTHVYYFASPRIGRPKEKVFSAATLHLFNEVFVEAFGHVATALAAHGRPVRLFYPSTVFIDELPAQHGEYIAAKAAAEVLCRHLDRHTAGLTVVCRRLQKLQTDQSSGLLGRGAADPVPVLLDVVRTMNSGAAEKVPT